MENKTMCQRCGKEFNRKRYWQKFCSRDCQRNDWILEKAKAIKKLAVLFFVFFFFSSNVFASTINVDKLVEAIGKSENSQKYPYGIKSINTHGNVDYAKKLCRQSVLNNIKRWERAKKPEGFVLFMSRRYCPINAPDDPNGLNVNWTKNVLHFYNMEAK